MLNIGTSNRVAEREEIGYSLHMMKNIIKKTEQFIRKYDMIRKSDVVAAGVSGGADSVCLLFVLCALREKLGFQIVVCHVNHCIRGKAAAADEEFVARLCRELDVPCRIFRENVELIARKRKQSLEEAGRDVRRAAFQEMCRTEGATKIATAHHRDDNAETVLLNIARGTGIKGLCGIRPVYGEWIRPLLSLSRQEIVEALRAENISWCTDATNEEDEYTRNRIRHNVLPVLCSQVNQGAAAHLDSLSRQAQEVWDYMDARTEEAWERCVSERENGLLIDGVCFEKEAPALKQFLIRRALSQTAGAERDIRSVHISAVEELFAKQPGRRLDLPFGVTASKVYEGVAMNRNSGKTEGERTRQEDDSVFINIPGETFFPATGQRISCRILENIKMDCVKEIPQKSYTKCFDYDIIKYGLSARTRRPGDYLVTGAGGERQKLKSWFINEKVPREQRDRILLIAEGSHILWIPGMRMSRAYQVGEKTERILEIKITEEKKDGRDDQSFDSGGRS